MRDIWEDLPVWVESFRQKNIYVFGIGPDSAAIFFMTLSGNFYVKAFIRNEAEEINPRIQVERFCNKAILSPEDMETESLVLHPAHLEIPDSMEKCIRERNCRLCPIRIQKVSDELLQRKTVIYGAANRGKKTLQLLRENGVKVAGFVDSDKSKIGSSFEGLEVLDFETIEKDTAVVISSGYYKEILQKLHHSGHPIFVDYSSIYGIAAYPYLLLKNTREKEDLVWTLQRHFYLFLRGCVDKKIIIDGYNDYGIELKRILSLMDKEIEYFVEDEVDKEESCAAVSSTVGYNTIIKSRQALQDEDMSDKMVIITKLELEENQPAIYREAVLLEKLGLKVKRDYCLIHNLGYTKAVTVKDPLLTFSHIYPETSKEYPQYILYGNPDKAKLRIMVLGNSTTDSGNRMSWVPFLADKLSDDVVIFNGGMGAYTVNQECLKLLRDIDVINPDIVISYSGVYLSYIRHPFFHRDFSSIWENDTSEFDFGPESEEALSDLWLRMQKTMKSICQNHGSAFIGILQPSIFTKRFLTEKEKYLFYYGVAEIAAYKMERYQNYYYQLLKVREMQDFTEDEDLYDFTDIFRDNTEEIFEDNAHVFDYGNKIIAEEIYKILNSQMQFLQKK